MADRDKKLSDMTYEEMEAALASVVLRLEEEQLPLEESLALYERGQQLAKACSDLLEKAEMRIRTLSTDGEEPAGQVG